jgi:hypothetical protein
VYGISLVRVWSWGAVDGRRSVWDTFFESLESIYTTMYTFEHVI